MARVLLEVADREDQRVKPNVVVRWQPDRPKTQDEPWSRMSDLDGRAERHREAGWARMLQSYG